MLLLLVISLTAETTNTRLQHILNGRTTTVNVNVVALNKVSINWKSAKNTFMDIFIIHILVIIYLCWWLRNDVCTETYMIHFIKFSSLLITWEWLILNQSSLGHLVFHNKYTHPMISLVPWMIGLITWTNISLPLISVRNCSCAGMFLEIQKHF